NQSRPSCQRGDSPIARPVIRVFISGCRASFGGIVITSLKGQRLHHDGKHFPNASNNRGEPLIRIFLRSKAQTRLRSFARNPSHVSLSAVTAISASPIRPSFTSSFWL